MAMESTNRFIVSVVLFVAIVAIFVIIMVRTEPIPKNMIGEAYSVKPIQKALLNVDCKRYYGGVSFDGFCFTDFENSVGEHPRAEEGIIVYTPIGSQVERTVKYPTSMEAVNWGIEEELKFILRNKGEQIEMVRLNNIRAFIYDMEDIPFDQEYIIQPGEELSIVIPLLFPNSGARLATNRYIVYSDNAAGHILPRITIYWSYDPFSEELVETRTCGSRTYAVTQAICIEDTLYPAVEARACQRNAPCPDGLSCYENSCFDLRNRLPPNRTYKVGLLPVIVTDSPTAYLQVEQEAQVLITYIVQKLNTWFENEKSYWRTSSQLSFDFQPLRGCHLGIEEGNALYPPYGRPSEEQLRILEQRCLNETDYDILILSLQPAESYPNTDGGGVNYGSIMSSALSKRTVMHELLHTFGAQDLYWEGSYQWGDCFLYGTDLGNQWNEAMPHLCKMEAMLLGFTPKFPRERIMVYTG